ncbi:hypothetical protein [Streptomyces sp. NPDC002530]
MAIAPVAHAIRVLEKITPPEGLLFDRNVHDFSRRRTLTGAPKQHTVRARITDFIAWCTTEAARHGLEHQTIPPDPAGNVGPARFRRTLARHIARRPGGLAALAFQCSHLRTGLDTESAGGYGTRSRGGIPVRQEARELPRRPPPSGRDDLDQGPHQDHPLITTECAPWVDRGSAAGEPLRLCGLAGVASAARAVGRAEDWRVPSDRIGPVKAA